MLKIWRKCSTVSPCCSTFCSSVLLVHAFIWLVKREIITSSSQLAMYLLYVKNFLPKLCIFSASVSPDMVCLPALMQFILFMVCLPVVKPIISDWIQVVSLYLLENVSICELKFVFHDLWVSLTICLEILTGLVATLLICAFWLVMHFLVYSYWKMEACTNCYPETGSSDEDVSPRIKDRSMESLFSQTQRVGGKIWKKHLKAY